MKFEKLNENKLRIIVNSQDLIENHIDFHAFMSNSSETQDLFMSILDRAEKEVGFVTKNYKVRIEAFSMNNEDFVFTVTRLSDKAEKDTLKLQKPKFKRKTTVNSPLQSIYRFGTFDDFLNFVNEFKNSNIKNTSTLCKTIELITYKNCFYLIFTNINDKNRNYDKLFSLLTEFSTHINNSELFASKLYECGKICFKHNAIKNCQKFFV